MPFERLGRVEQGPDLREIVCATGGAKDQVAPDEAGHEREGGDHVEELHDIGE
jgi:hypothetical protein